MCLKENVKRYPKNFIFGYGSIINTMSRVGTGGKNIGNAVPAILQASAGYRRAGTFKTKHYARHCF